MINSNFNLKPNKFLDSCNSKDVISFGSVGTFTLRQLFGSISSAFNKPIIHAISKSIERELEHKCDANLLLSDGKKCEILQAGSGGWQTGRLKLKVNLTLEFIAERPIASESLNASQLENNNLHASNQSDREEDLV